MVFKRYLGQFIIGSLTGAVAS